MNTVWKIYVHLKTRSVESVMCGHIISLQITGYVAFLCKIQVLAQCFQFQCPVCCSPVFQKSIVAVI